MSAHELPEFPAPFRGGLTSVSYWPGGRLAVCGWIALPDGEIQALEAAIDGQAVKPLRHFISTCAADVVPGAAPEPFSYFAEVFQLGDSGPTEHEIAFIAATSDARRLAASIKLP